MKSKKKSWLVLIVVVLMIAACSYVSAYGYGKDHIGTAKNIKLGLDLAGGVNITYEADEDNPSAEDMNDTVYKLQQRVEAWSTEAEVYQEGTNWATLVLSVSVKQSPMRQQARKYWMVTVKLWAAKASRVLRLHPRKTAMATHSTWFL